MNHKIGNLFKGDKVIWMVFFMLCMISIVEVFSASSGLTYKNNNFFLPIMKHSMTIIGGLVAAMVMVYIPCRFFKLLTPVLILVSFFTLLWVLFAGETINGANRVIEIAGQTFQPSEIAKGTMVLAAADRTWHNRQEGNAFHLVPAIAFCCPYRQGKPLDSGIALYRNIPDDANRTCSYGAAWQVARCSACLDKCGCR